MHITYLHTTVQTWNTGLGVLPLSHQVSYDLGSCLRFISRTEDQNIVALLPRIFDFTMSLDNFITSHDDFNMCFDDLTKRAAT